LQEIFVKKITIFILLVGFAAAMGFSSMAFAKNDKNHGHGPAKVKKASSADGLIGHSNRETIKLYLKENYGRKCPPGLAKKNNGCLPPGIAKKYSIGKPLPEDVFESSLPNDLLKLLYPPRYGQKYVQVDKDVLLIDQVSRKVIDAITLMSAVGN
jgi:hypothetical protein